MKTFFNLLAVIILLSSCNTMKQNEKNDKFYLDDSHLKDEAILKEKREVIEFIKTFDKWYKDAGKGILLQYTGWRMEGHGQFSNDRTRINIIKTDILREVKKTNLLSKFLKERVITNIQTKDDPQNLGTLLLEDMESMGRHIYQFIQFESNSQLMNYAGFNINRDEMEGTYKELENYYLKMISIGEVIKYNFPFNVVMNDYANYYVNVYIIKEEGNYKVDQIEVKKFENEDK